MGVVKTVKKAVEGAGKGRKKRSKQFKKAQNLRDKKQLKDNIESHLSHASLSYASDPSAIISKMRVKPTSSDGTISSVVKPSGAPVIKAPLRVPEVPKLTPKQEELVESLNRELHIDGENPSGTSAAGGNARSKKSGGGTTRTEEHPTGGAGDSTRTTSTDTETPEERQTVQPGDEEPSGAPKSGGKYNPAEFMEKSKDKNLGRSERWMLERLGNMRANAQKVFEKGTDEQIKNELGRWGIEAKDGDKVADYMNKIDEMLKEKAESGPTLGDKFRSHHGVGLTGLGVVGVSTLDLANSRGQQSNAQLYSDPFA